LLKSSCMASSIHPWKGLKNDKRIQVAGGGCSVVGFVYGYSG
jgi:hypothetical protein